MKVTDAGLRAQIEHLNATESTALEQTPAPELQAVEAKQEEAEGAAQGWMPLRTACHRLVPAALLAEIVEQLQSVQQS